MLVFRFNFVIQRSPGLDSSENFFPPSVIIRESTWEHEYGT